MVPCILLKVWKLSLDHIRFWDSQGRKSRGLKLNLKTWKHKNIGIKWPWERTYFILGFRTISEMQLKTNKQTYKINSVYKAEYIRISSGSSGANLPFLFPTLSHFNQTPKWNLPFLYQFTLTSKIISDVTISLMYASIRIQKFILT